MSQRHPWPLYHAELRVEPLELEPEQRRHLGPRLDLPERELIVPWPPNRPQQVPSRLTNELDRIRDPSTGKLELIPILARTDTSLVLLTQHVSTDQMLLPQGPAPAHRRPHGGTRVDRDHHGGSPGAAEIAGHVAQLLSPTRRADIMAMPNLVRRYTVADLATMPDDGMRYELIGGELIVSPAPSVHHQIVLRRLANVLAAYLEPLGLADTLFDGAADVSWDDENSVQPDLLVIRPEELSGTWTTVRNLRLAVEVISPSSRRRDRLDKRRLYQEHRVETYWIVDLEAGLVEQWRPDDTRPEIISDSLRWRVDRDTPEVSIDVVRLFADLPA